jgi:hypothetical protein
MHEANRAIGAITQHPLPEPLLRAAWSYIDFTTDPLLETIVANARAAEGLGFVPSSDVRGLVDARFLRAQPR